MDFSRYFVAVLSTFAADKDQQHSEIREIVGNSLLLCLLYYIVGHKMFSNQPIKFDHLLSKSTRAPTGSNVQKKESMCA